ncbi:MAG: pyridoxal-dependent decarboxylase [Rhodothermales bacterium]
MQKEPCETAALRYAFDRSIDYLAGLDSASVGTTVADATLRERLERPLPDGPMDPVEVVSDLVAGVEGGLTASTGGRFFGWVIGGTVPAALAADWLTSTWDQVPGVYAVSPAASIVEEVCGAWLLELLGLPATASYALVTGCQMAHVTCLGAARNEVLARAGWDVEERGLFGAPAIRVVSGARRHGTIERALRMLGMGRACLVDIPLEPGAQLTAGALDAVLAEAPGQPTIVLLQAGDVNTGGFDPFADVIPVAHRHGAWVHVDGAFGLWAAASPAYRHLTRGVEQADSWATDGHKWLNVPYDSGYAFVTNREAHHRSLSHHASYLHKSTEIRDAVDWTPEHSRRARGFATYAAIRSLGRSGVARLVDDGCRHARALVDAAGRLPGVEVVQRPIINQGILRFLDPAPGATEADHDRRTDAIMAAVMATGEALFTGTLLYGRRCMRVSVSSWKTTDEDVRRAVQAIATCLRAADS